MKTAWAAVGLAAVAVAFGATGASAMSASFRWCSGSPEFHIAGAPKGTTKLDLHMVDLQVPSYAHGGGVVAYKGQRSIPCGAISGGYRGPSPPPPQVHSYEWTIKALDAAGATLAVAKATRRYPEK